MSTNPKQEVLKTTVAVLAALGMIGTFVGVYYVTQPKQPDLYKLVGKEFYSDFESSSQIAAMTMEALDTNGELQKFSLEKTGSLWTIPTHSSYPAEAGQRLSNTATALLGLERLRLASSEKGAQARLGVLDPTSEEAKESPDEAGKLIRFSDVNDETIFELIVGKRLVNEENMSVYDFAPDQSDENLYYVRVPAEKDTYVAQLDLDISTKFSDWINQDLLEASSDQFRALELDNYRLESRQVMTNRGIMVQRQLVPEDQLLLTRESASDPWTMADLTEQEEVNPEKVSQVIEAIESLELLDVRPQYRYEGQSLLGDDLSVQLPDALKDDQAAANAAVNAMQDELIEAGFAIAQDPQGELRMVAENGELEVTTNEGLIYTMLYGAETKGSGANIEIGSSENSKEEEQADGSTEDADADTATGQADDETGRLVLIRVRFDESRVEGKPQEPIEPEKMELPPEEPEMEGQKPGFDAPPRPKPIANQKPDTSELNQTEAAGDSSTDDPVVGNEAANSPTGDEGQNTDGGGLFSLQDTQVSGANDQQDTEQAQPSPRELAQQQIDNMYQQQLAQYEAAKQQYQTDLKAYQDRVAELKEKAARLRERYAGWFYVVPNRDLAVLRLSRKDAVRPKQEGDPNGANPGLNPLQLPPGFDPSMFQQQ